MPQGFSDQGAVRRVTGLQVRPVILRDSLLDDVTEAVILIERLDAAGVDNLLQGQRSIGAKVLNQHAMSGCIVGHMLGGVVLADDAGTVDVARAIGMPQGFGGQSTVRSVAGLKVRPVILRDSLLDDVTEAVILIERLDAAGVDNLLQGQRSIGAKVLNQHAMSGCIVGHMLGGVVLADDAGTVDVARAIGMPQGFGGQSTVRSVAGLQVRPVILRDSLLDDVTEAVILIERLDAAGVDNLLQGQRSIGAKVLNQHAMSGCIVGHMLGGVVLADDAGTVDVARAIGMPQGFGGQSTVRSVAGLKVRPVILRDSLLDDVTEAVILIERLDAAGVDNLLQGQRSIGAKVLNQHAMSGCIVGHMLGGVVLADDAGTVDVARAIGMPQGFGGQSTVRSVAGLKVRPVILRDSLLDDVTEAVILIERLDAAGVDNLLQGQRSIGAKVLNQHAMSGCIVDHMLGSVVLADDA